MNGICQLDIYCQIWCICTLNQSKTHKLWKYLSSTSSSQIKLRSNTELFCIWGNGRREGVKNMSSYVCPSDEVSNLSIWVKVQMIQLMWNDYFKCIPHLLLLENDLMLSDFMTKVFKNCSFTASTKPNCYFWPCSIFCSVLVVIMTLDLMNECADVSVNPCAWNGNMVIMSHQQYIFAYTFFFFLLLMGHLILFVCYF